MLRQSLSLKPSFKIRGNPIVSLRGIFGQIGMQRLSLFLNQVKPGLADKSGFNCGMQRLGLGLCYPVCYLDLLPRFITTGWQV